MELFFDDQVVDLATIYEIWEGLRRVTFINILKILYGLVNNSFLGGGSSEYMEFGAGNCMFDFVTLVHIVRVLSHKYVGLSST